ncbi:MAG: BON domain-containing protein [Granulosicoccus sp.]
MNNSIKTSLVALAMAALIAGPVSANVPTQSIAGAVNSAITTGNVNVRVENGTATLFGWVEDAHTEQAVKRAALQFDNVDRVVDQITISN